MTQQRPTYAIVGGGASGTIAAIALLRHPSVAHRHVVIVDPSRQLGAGIAYGTASASHLLNVRALGMSAFPDDPSDFVRWARRQGLGVAGPEFLPRTRYAAYLRDTLAEMAAGAPSQVSVEHLRRTVRDVVPDPVGRSVVRLDDGTTLAADHVILATGNRSTTPAWLPQHARVIPDPWRPGAMDAAGGAGSVLIIGSGLTAVDVVLSLRDGGFRGTATLVSGHGFLPASHRPAVLPPRSPAVRAGTPAAGTARSLVRSLREDAWTADDWRQTIDGVRSETVGIWRGLPQVEQRRALRHAFRFWEVRRHRMAPEIAEALETLMADGRVALERAHVSTIEPSAGGVRVAIARDGTEQTRRTDLVISCIGPSADPADDPLLCRLLGAGTVTRHPLRMGLDIEVDGRVRAAGGTPWNSVWAIGPLRKGADWESTAVPEIRIHARALAASMLGAA